MTDLGFQAYAQSILSSPIFGAREVDFGFDEKPHPRPPDVLAVMHSPADIVVFKVFVGLSRKGNVCAKGSFFTQVHVQAWANGPTGPIGVDDSIDPIPPSEAVTVANGAMEVESARGAGVVIEDGVEVLLKMHQPRTNLLFSLPPSLDVKLGGKAKAGSDVEVEALAKVFVEDPSQSCVHSKIFTGGFPRTKGIAVFTDLSIDEGFRGTIEDEVHLLFEVGQMKARAQSKDGFDGISLDELGARAETKETAVDVGLLFWLGTFEQEVLIKKSGRVQEVLARDAVTVVDPLLPSVSFVLGLGALEEFVFDPVL